MEWMIAGGVGGEVSVVRLLVSFVCLSSHMFGNVSCRWRRKAGKYKCNICNALTTTTTEPRTNVARSTIGLLCLHAIHVYIYVIFLLQFQWNFNKTKVKKKTKENTMHMNSLNERVSTLSIYLRLFFNPLPPLLSASFNRFQIIYLQCIIKEKKCSFVSYKQ